MEDLVATVAATTVPITHFAYARSPNKGVCVQFEGVEVANAGVFKVIK